MPLLSRTSNLRLLKIGARTPKAIEKEAGPKGNEPALIKALRESWNDVVRPVVENLPQIWWCPTCLLLLNAAGECGAGIESLSQQYISSQSSRGCVQWSNQNKILCCLVNGMHDYCLIAILTKSTRQSVQNFVVEFIDMDIQRGKECTMKTGLGVFENMWREEIHGVVEACGCCYECEILSISRAIFSNPIHEYCELREITGHPCG